MSFPKMKKVRHGFLWLKTKLVPYMWKDLERDPAGYIHTLCRTEVRVGQNLRLSRHSDVPISDGMFYYCPKCMILVSRDQPRNKSTKDEPAKPDEQLPNNVPEEKVGKLEHIITSRGEVDAD